MSTSHLKVIELMTASAQRDVISRSTLISTINIRPVNTFWCSSLLATVFTLLGRSFNPVQPIMQRPVTSFITFPCMMVYTFWHQLMIQLRPWLMSFWELVPLTILRQHGTRACPRAILPTRPRWQNPKLFGAGFTDESNFLYAWSWTGAEVQSAEFLGNRTEEISDTTTAQAIPRGQIACGDDNSFLRIAIAAADPSCFGFT